jgi:hypothetical protein
MTHFSSVVGVIAANTPNAAHRKFGICAYDGDSGLMGCWNDVLHGE